MTATSGSGRPGGEPGPLERALADPRTWAGIAGDGRAPVEVEATHISLVFLVADRAFKLKRAVRFPFLDFSTRERRLAACRDELRLNRRLCPDLYLAVRPVLRDADGRLRVGPALPRPVAPGTEIVDHLVEMRRMPSSGMLPRLLAAGRVSAPEIAALARDLARFHATCPADVRVHRWASLAALADRWRREVTEIHDLVAALLPAGERAILAEFGPRFLADNRDLFERRRATGRIREGHGDLHAGNVCRVELGDRPAPDAAELAQPPAGPGPFRAFDCIEFSEEFRCNDVASEVAFLAMDLERRGRADLAAAFVDAYVEAAGDPELRALLPFYGCYRAVVRGKVEALAAESGPPGRAPSLPPLVRKAFDLAVRDAMRALAPAALLVGGRSGSGKTTVAHGIARCTGWLHLSSDEIRKRGQAGTAGRAPEEPGPGTRAAELPTPDYAPEARRRNYEVLIDAARAELARGRSVVVDATFLHLADRELARTVLGERDGPAPLLLWCVASEGTTRERLAARAAAGSGPALADPALARVERLSDATWETWLAQARELDPPAAPEEFLELSSEGEMPDVLGRALFLVWRRRLERPGALGASTSGSRAHREPRL